MRITVAIPAYNEEKRLPATLASIAKLIRTPDEVLVVDGGSTDKTRDVARAFGARVLTVPHRGIGFARQEGLLAATGDVVAWTDADTQVPATWLGAIEETLEKPGVVAVYGHYIVSGGWWVYRWIINYFQPAWIRVMQLLRRPIAPGQNTAYWKDKALEAGGYPVGFQSAEDLEMARRLFTKGKVVYLPKNAVASDSRRGNEGWAFFPRMVKVFFRYYILGKAETSTFPHIR